VIALSASKITTCLQRPRRYRVRYVAPIAATWKLSALALSSAVHGELKTFHREHVAASMVPAAIDELLAGHRVRELKAESRGYDEASLSRAYDEASLSRHVQISAYAQACRRLFGPDCMVEVVALLTQRQSRIAVHEATQTFEQPGWLVQLMVDIAGAIAARAFPPNPSWACTGREFAEPCRATGGAS
jgi:hypothetical protein